MRIQTTHYILNLFLSSIVAYFKTDIETNLTSINVILTENLTKKNSEKK